MLEVKTATDTFEKDLINCNAESDGGIISTKSCTIPTTVLRSNPFNIGDLETISAKVAAINDIGASAWSAEGTATMPTADVVPDPPTDLVAAAKM